MKRLLLALSFASLAVTASGCAAETSNDPNDQVASEDVSASTDAKVKTAVEKTTKGVSFLSESDHTLDWISTASVPTTVTNAAFVHRYFNAVTNGDAQADKPLSSLHSETVDFEKFAGTFVAVKGEDPDNYAYHQQMTKVLDSVRSHIKNPVVISMGKKDASGPWLEGAISVYIIGTLPSGKVGGLFTVSVET
jgi:hypothetical protein